MNWIIRIYRLCLLLYPTSFRRRFAQEMEEVFALSIAGQIPQMSRFRLILREVGSLPSSLLNAYLWAARSSEDSSLALSGAGGGSVPSSEPRPGRVDLFLAVLPHLLLGLIGGVPYLVNAWNQDLKLPDALGTLLPFLLLIPALLFALLYGVLKGWGRWLASWKTYLLAVPTLFIATIFQNILDRPGKNDGDWANLLITFLLPLLLAFLLYAVTAKDRLAGLLAAIPAMMVMWVVFHEFVPDLYRGLAWFWTCGLASIAAAGILKNRRWNAALLYALALPVFGGFPNVFLGVYMGGTLPFSEPGPSLREVIRQYLPFLALTCAMVIGPQLAWQIRQLGMSGSATGKRWHRITLLAILMVLLLVLFRSTVAITGGSPGVILLRGKLLANFSLLFGIGEFFFLVSYVFLIRSSMESGGLWNIQHVAARTALLPICLAWLPFILLFNIPEMSSFFDVFNNSFWLPLISLAWVAASTWVIKE